MLNGRRVREFGVNCSDLFLDWRGGAINTSTPVVYQSQAKRVAVFEAMKQDGVRFVRYLVTGFRPKTYRVGFVENQAAFLAAHDELVADAERRQILLIPSLFFNVASIPPYVTEDLQQWGVTGSATQTQMEAVISTIVPRYKNSPAIAYWEASNEADVRMGGGAPAYSIDVPMETPAAWTAADDILAVHMRNFTQYFHDRVRNYDGGAAWSGSNPRATASGNQGWRGNFSKKCDFANVVQSIQNDDRTDTATLHPYENHGAYRTDYVGIGGYLSWMASRLRALGKPLIVGEFGVPDNFATNGRSPDDAFAEKAAAIRDSGIDLALVWDYLCSPNIDTQWDRRGVRAKDMAILKSYNATMRA